MLGSFGAVSFSAATFLVKEMKRTASSDWAEQKILNNIPTLERTGGELCTFSCVLTFNRRHTLPFEVGVALLEGYAKNGNNFPLIIGFQLIGGFQAPNFILTKVESSYGIVDNVGRGLHSTVNCEFKQYRVTISTGSASAGSLGNLGTALGGIASSVSQVFSGGLGTVATGALTGGLTGGLGGAVQGALGGALSNVIPSAVSTLSGAFNAAGGVLGAVNGIPNMLGQIGSKALAVISPSAGGTGALLPGGVKIG
jgi:Phage P2 GpU